MESILYFLIAPNLNLVQKEDKNNFLDTSRPGHTYTFSFPSQNFQAQKLDKTASGKYEGDRASKYLFDNTGQDRQEITLQHDKQKQDDIICTNE